MLCKHIPHSGNMLCKHILQSGNILCKHILQSGYELKYLSVYCTTNTLFCLLRNLFWSNFNDNVETLESVHCVDCLLRFFMNKHPLSPICCSVFFWSEIPNRKHLKGLCFFNSRHKVETGCSIDSHNSLEKKILGLLHKSSSISLALVEKKWY